MEVYIWCWVFGIWNGMESKDQDEMEWMDGLHAGKAH
jgi:hypothetical protein